MPTYYSLITNNGLVSHANASLNAVNLDLIELAVGDSNGAYYDPDGTEIALQNELYRTTLTHVVIDENNPNQLIIEGVVDETIGPFFVREVGVFDSNGDLFAVGKYPETFKPNLPSGSGKKLYIRMILGFASAPNVTLIASDINNDPNFSTYVNDELNNRLKISEDLSDLNDKQIARNNLELKNGAISDLTGAIIPYSMTSPPNGWLECDGSLLSRTTYVDLFNKIGVVYGSGDGSTTFSIPDLRGEFIRGWDSGRGVDVNRNLASNQLDALQGHWHNVLAGLSGGNYVSRSNGGTSSQANYSSARSLISDGSNGTPRIASETRPRNIALMYCIKY